MTNDERPTDEQPTDAEAKKNADAIEDVNATQTGSRGNVISEQEDGGPDQDGPPPLPH